MRETARLLSDGKTAGETPAPARPWRPAELPHASPGMDDRLVGLLSPSSFDAEPYRILVTSLERIRGQRSSLVLAVTSAAPGDGKTTTAINLAGMLARRPGCRVLLMDADLRRPSIAKGLGLEGQEGPGVVRLLQEPGLGLADAVLSWPALALSVLPAGGATLLAHEALQSREFAGLVEAARTHHRYVVLDTPPVVALPDARALADVVDGFLLVVRAGSTPRRLLAEALDALEPTKVLGLVFNGDERPLAGYYGRYRSYYASSARRESIPPRSL
jgi:protein-tyrosine kinase